MLSIDENNYFKDWTRVLLCYCDGAGHQGSKLDPISYKGIYTFLISKIDKNSINNFINFNFIDFHQNFHHTQSYKGRNIYFRGFNITLAQFDQL